MRALGEEVQDDPFGYVNLNKRGGFGRTDYTRLKNYAKRYRAFLKRQLALMAPEKIVFCGCYDGAAEDYNIFTGAAYDNDDYKPTKYLEIDYNSSWYKPEIVAGTLFFCNAETNADTYVYAMQNPADNAALAALNEQYKATQDKIAELDTDFADAANLARYYYYTGNLDLPQDENDEYFERYQEEDFVIANAYAECAVPEGYHFDFTSLKEGETAYNVQSAFYRVVGTVAEEDAETIADTLATTYLKADDSTETTEETPWTWQWAAIFVPVGLVVIAGVVVAIVLVRRRRARR